MASGIYYPSSQYDFDPCYGSVSDSIPVMAGTFSGKAYQIYTSSTDGGMTYYPPWDGNNDFDLLVRVKTTSKISSTSVGIFFNTSNRGQGWFLRMNGNNTLTLTKRDDNLISTAMGSVSFTWNMDTWYLMRMRRTSAHMFYCKAWVYGVPEPQWMITAGPDSSHSTCTHHGVFLLPQAGTTYYDFFSYGTAGSTPFRITPKGNGGQLSIRRNSVTNRIRLVDPTSSNIFCPKFKIQTNNGPRYLDVVPDWLDDPHKNSGVKLFIGAQTFCAREVSSYLLEP